MSLTLTRQETQIRNSDTYTDNLAAGVALETGAAEIEADLNALRSQLNRIFDSTVTGNWYDDVATVNSKQRGLLQLNTDLDDVEEHRFCFRTQVLQGIAVPAAQNWVVLNVAGTEAPSLTAALVSTTLGAIGVQHDGTFGTTHSLAIVAGSNAITPGNLAAVVDAAGDPILSGGKRVAALLQTESAVDGHTFNDTTEQVQLSFVRVTAAGTGLEAVPVGDIASTTIQYSYKQRLNYDALPEDAFLGDGLFVDQSAAVDVTLDNAIDNQAGAATQAQNIDVDIADGNDWCFRDSASADLLCVKANAGAGTSEVEVGADVDLYDNRAVDVDFQSGASLALGTTRIDVGLTAGVIETTGSDDLRVLGAGELLLDDGNQAGSTWAQTTGIKLSETTAEWDLFETTFGEVSLLSAIVQAKAAGLTLQSWAVVSGNNAPDTDIGGTSGGANLDAQLIDMSSGNFETDYAVYLNGSLMRPGADASANHDYYPGTSLALGQLRFERRLRDGDQIFVISRV